jgi:hypothetical protein
MLKLTMNLPAEKKFFKEDEGIVGVKLRLTDGTLQIRPVSRALKTPDFVPFTPRARGGVELLIDSEIENEIATTLKSLGRNEFFFLHERADSDWLSIQAYDGEEKYPPRQKPHLRAWNLMDSPSSSTVIKEVVKEIVTPDEVLAEVRKAVSLVKKHDSSERTADKPENVAEAESLIGSIRTILKEIVDLDLVIQARDILNKALGGSGGPDRPRIPAPTEELGQSVPDLSGEVGGERALAEERANTKRKTTRTMQAAAA